jgi:hypothetical protein
MTLKARKQRAVDGAELRAAMFQVTINTLEPGIDVGPNHRWDERLCGVARCTLCNMLPLTEWHEVQAPLFTRFAIGGLRLRLRSRVRIRYLPRRNARP